MSLHIVPGSRAAVVLLLLMALTPCLGSLTAPRPTTAAPLPANLAWSWPLAGKPKVARAFDPPARPWLSGHRGVDLLASQESPVMAPTDGVVSFSGIVVDRHVLSLVVAGGLSVSLEPVRSELKAGDAVLRGQYLGMVSGPTHCRDPALSGGCLHWGVRRGEEYLDPLQFVLDLRPSVLLPLRNQAIGVAAAGRSARR